MFPVSGVAVRLNKKKDSQGAGPETGSWLHLLNVALIFKSG